MNSGQQRARLYHRQHGEGKIDVVFVHGNLGSADHWRLVESRLPKSIKGTFLDLRGCGKSEKPEPSLDYANYSFSLLAGDLLNLLDELRIESCVLVGHSTGALVSLHAFFDDPQRFRGLFLLDPAGPRGVDLRDSMHIFQAARNDADVAFALISTTMPSVFEKTEVGSSSRPSYLPTATAEQRELIEFIATQRHTASDGVWFGFARNLTKENQTHPLLGRISEIKIPVWIIWGERDLWIKRDDMEELNDLLVRSRLIVVPDRGQSLHLEDPDNFIKILKDYLKEEQI